MIKQTLSPSKKLWTAGSCALLFFVHEKVDTILEQTYELINLPWKQWSDILLLFSMDIGQPFDPAHCITSFLEISTLISASWAPTGPYCETPCSHSVISIINLEYFCWFSVAWGKNTATPHKIRFCLVVCKMTETPSLPCVSSNDPATGKRM